MNTMLSRTLAVGLLAILSFALVTGLVIRVGFQSILEDSERRNEAALAEYIGRQLASISAETGSSEAGTKTMNAIEEALRELPVRTEYVVIVDRGERVMYLSNKGKARPIVELRLAGKLLTGKMLAKADWHEVPAAGRARFKFAFKTIRVDAEQSNRYVLDGIKKTAVFGALGAIIIAGILAFLLSSSMAKQAKRLAGALSEMREGRRDVTVPQGGMKELGEIAASAASLQETLIKEESTRLQWTADVAHDLRTPLTVLKGQFEGMIDGVFQADKARLERNYREILNLERIINQLADLTRMETPGYEPHRAELDALELMRAQVQRFATAAEARSLELSIDADEREIWKLEADAALLERALANLADNAIRYGDAPGKIRFALVRSESGDIELSATNTGLIDESDRPRVFGRLYRGDRSRSTEGSGLGLAIVRAIAQAHGGSASLECDEAANKTTFAIRIPRVG
jgi:two-component system sensor histidine kinase BaeS